MRAALARLRAAGTTAHDNYAHTEESLTQLCNQISSPLKIS